MYGLYAAGSECVSVADYHEWSIERITAMTVILHACAV